MYRHDSSTNIICVFALLACLFFSHN